MLSFCGLAVVQVPRAFLEECCSCRHSDSQAHVSTSGTEAGAVLAALAAAGTHSGACALRWLQVQGVAVKHVSGLEAIDRDAERLSLLLRSLPALESLIVVKLHAAASCTSPADASDFLAGAARALGRCPCLLHLKLTILLNTWEDQLPETVGQDLAGARTLEGLEVAVRCWRVADLDMPPVAHTAHLVAGLAGLSRLRALKLESNYVEAPLPACLSRLAQLTSFTLSGLNGLRCAPGWARLPLLASLKIEWCTFAADGEDALPGMDALTALTSLSLAGYNSPVFPLGILAMSRLKHLDLTHGYFEHVPEGVSVLTALEVLRLGRYNGPCEWGTYGVGHIGGSLDARALGSLAGFPRLRCLAFKNCCVLLCPSIQAAAVHPRLERLRLRSSYPASGPSWLAFLELVGGLLRQGRPDALELRNCYFSGAGQQECRSFCAALQAVGFPEDKIPRYSTCYDSE